MTAATALDRQIAHHRRMTGEQRLAVALDLHEMSCDNSFFRYNGNSHAHLAESLMSSAKTILRRLPLLLTAAAVVAAVMRLPSEIVFTLAFAALIPLANMMSHATEALAMHFGPKIGGLLNATLGTLTEFIIMFALLRSGQTELLKASIVGSLLISLLLTVGAAILFGGLRHGMQRFDKESVGMASAAMILAVVGLFVPTFLSFVIQKQESRHFLANFQNAAVDKLSLAVAGVLFLLYLATVLYQLRSPAGEEHLAQKPSAARPPNQAEWSKRQAVAAILSATLGVAVVAEILSGAAEPFGVSLGLSYLFVGIVILPVVGAISEIVSCVRLARSNMVDLAISIPLNGAMQMSLFVVPLLVFLSAFDGTPLTLSFGASEVIAVVITVALAAYIAIDGLTSWLEGAQLLALWGILALLFFFYVPLPPGAR
jgi:Ca2+:H+ antiporter